MPFAFEKLHVYQRALDFADAVCSTTEGIPRGYGCLVEAIAKMLSGLIKGCEEQRI